MKKALLSFIPIIAFALTLTAFAFYPANNETDNCSEYPINVLGATELKVIYLKQDSQWDDAEYLEANIFDTCSTNNASGVNTPPMPYPITRLGQTIYIDCPFTLLSQDSAGNWQEADYIEPEFEVAPENVLWLIEPERSYRMQVDFGGRIQNIDPEHLPAGTRYNFNIIYTGQVDEGGLGTIQIEFSEQIGEIFMVYRGVLKFVADQGANLFCTPNATLDSKGILTVELRPRAEGETFSHQFEISTTFADNVMTNAIQDWTKTTVYDADLSHYLYPYGVPEELTWYFEENPTLNPDLTDTYHIAVG